MKTNFSKQVVLKKFISWPLGDERWPKKGRLTFCFSSKLFLSRQLLDLIEWIIFKVAFRSHGRALLLLHSTLISHSDLTRRKKKVVSVIGFWKTVISFSFLSRYAKNSRILLLLFFLHSLWSLPTLITQLWLDKILALATRACTVSVGSPALLRNFLKNADVRFPIGPKICMYCPSLPRDKTWD